MIDTAEITRAEQERRRLLQAEITARYPDTDTADGQGDSEGDECPDCGVQMDCCRACHEPHCSGPPECGECGEHEDDCTCNNEDD